MKYLGNNRLVADAAGTILQTNHYDPYGESLPDGAAVDSGNPYKYSGKEYDDKALAYDFGARHYTSSIPRWTTMDPLCEKYYSLSPYAYCHDNPINRSDKYGLWDVVVSAHSDRANNPYAIYTVYDRQGYLVFQTVVKVKGKYRDRTRINGDTPTGKYQILGWRDTGNTRYPADSYGTSPLLALDYVEGEAYEAGRNGMHTHEGGPQGPDLRSTYGCIRMSKEDIEEFKSIVDALEANDSEERKGFLTVANTLNESIRFQDRDMIKNYIQEVDGGILDPAFIVDENTRGTNNEYLQDYLLSQFRLLPSGTTVYLY